MQYTNSHMQTAFTLTVRKREVAAVILQILKVRPDVAWENG